MSFNLGAGCISFPIKSIINTLDLTANPTGHGNVPSILLRFLNYFYAHLATIFLGFDEQYPLLNLNYPLTYLSLSLNTNIDVLYILIAYYFPVILFIEWYTLAYLPVDKQPFI